MDKLRKTINKITDLDKNDKQWFYNYLKKYKQIENQSSDIFPNDITKFKYNINKDSSILDPGEEKYAYGVLVDFRDGKSTDEDGVCTRIGNMDFHRTLPCHTHKGQIYSLTEHRVLTELNPDNWNLPYNGYTAEQIASMMADSNNTIEIHTDKFYCTSKILHTNLNGNPDLFKVMFSPVKINDRYFEVKEQATDFRKGRLCLIDGNWQVAANLAEPSSNVVGGFQDTFPQIKSDNNGKVPITGFSRVKRRNYIQNDRYIQNYYSYQYIIYWAFVIEYNTLNSRKTVNIELDENNYHQGGLGIGMTSVEENITIWTDGDYYFGANDDTMFKPTVRNIGCTNLLGNHSGEIIVQENGHTYHQNRYRGFEFPFGDIGGMVDGFATFTTNDRVADGDGDPILFTYINYYLSDNPLKYSDTPDGARNNMELVAKVVRNNEDYSYDEGTFRRAVIGDKALLIPCERDDNLTGNFYSSQYGGGDYLITDEYVGAICSLGGNADCKINISSIPGLSFFEAVGSPITPISASSCCYTRFIDN